ncbi:MAG: hypothetical protein ACLP7P_07295 [Rhodomicrobium sp.]
MTNTLTGQDQGKTSSTHPEEWFSIILALIAAGGAWIYIGYCPSCEPERPIYWIIPVWFGLIYLIVQMAFLLMSANQVRALGVLDSVIAIVPLVVGMVMVALTILVPAKLPLSNYQLNTLAVLIVTGGAEFLLTIWIRFIVNRRTLGVGGSN